MLRMEYKYGTKTSTQDVDSMKLRPLLLLSLLAIPSLAIASGRQRTLFDANWLFHRGDVNNSSAKSVKSWLWRETKVTSAPDSPPSNLLQNQDWKSAYPGEDTFHGRIGDNWYVAKLPAFNKPNPVLHFQYIDDNGDIYLNGKHLLHHEGYSQSFDVPLASAWNANGPNIVMVLVQNTAAGGGIGPTRLELKTSLLNPAFSKPAFDDAAWRSIHLPNDFVVEGKFTKSADTGHGSLPVGVGWYRKHFTLPTIDSGKQIWLNFEGVYRDSTYWINGHLLGNHQSGYIGVRYDITPYVHLGGQNTLAVRVDAREPEGWWYEGGGIYRHVWLVVTSPVHIVPDGLYVAPKVNNNGSSTVPVRVHVVNESGSTEHFVLVVSINSSSSAHSMTKMVSASLTPGANKRLAISFDISHPALWSIHHPNLYHLTAKLVHSGKVLDDVTTYFGVRTIYFDPNKGFFLNGKHVELKGTCNHQDFAGLGIAMPNSILTWRIEQLKKMGSNAYRCSHNPPAPGLLAACDKLGMVVMDENRHLGDTYSPKTGPGTPYKNLSDLKAMIRRDRNHPSIIMWSMCNEEPLQGTPEGTRIFTAMRNATLKLDPTRPVTCAMNGNWGQGISNVEDLQGCNYNPGSYDWFHKHFPDKPMYGSEIGSTVSDRGEYVNNPTKGYVSGYDVNAPPWADTAEVTWSSIATRPFMAGGFVWTGFDYKGEPTPYGWPCINSHFGLIDEAGFPKDDYYFYQAWWSHQTVLHILPPWTWPGKEGQSIPVWVYSNCAKVALFLNGKPLGEQVMPKYGHDQWNVTYEPGTLIAKGYDADGKLIATTKEVTTGPPAHIVLTTEWKRLKDNGENTAVVDVAITDAHGNVVPYAHNMVTFSVHGPGQISGVGNGDPSSHEPDKADNRSAFHGLCMADLQAGSRPGRLSITASSPGLTSATVTLKVVKD